MSDIAFQTAIAEILMRHGIDVTNDPVRLRNLLRDYCTSEACRREISLTVLCAKNGLLASIREIGAQTPLDAYLNRLVGILHDEYGIDQALARSVVWTWTTQFDDFHLFLQLRRDCICTYYTMGCFYDWGGSWCKCSPNWAFACFHLAADDGHAESQYKVGMAYLTGHGVPKNNRLAYHWILKSAKQENGKALFALAQAYDHGYYFPQNLILAVHYYAKAAIAFSIQDNIDCSSGDYDWEAELLQIITGDCASILVASLGNGRLEDLEPWISSIKSNNSDTLIGLFYLYECGIGVVQNADLSLKYLRQAAESNDPVAQRVLAQKLLAVKETEENNRSLFKWAKLSAEQGDCYAQFMLGLAYEFGKGIDKDESEAFRWYKSAALQNHKKAQQQVANMLEIGQGVEKDQLKAKEWLKSTYSGWASHELAPLMTVEERTLVISDGNGFGSKYQAHLKLGHYYKNKGDYSAAARWFRLALDVTECEAAFELGQLYENARGVIRDAKEAVRLFKIARFKHPAVKEHLEALAKSGYAEAQYALAGDSFERNEDQLDWLYKAAGQKSYEAMSSICMMLASGLHNKVRYKGPDVVNWCRKMAENGDAALQGCLGEIYMHGFGVDKNEAESLRWFRLSSVHGSDNAMEILTKLLSKNNRKVPSVLQTDTGIFSPGMCSIWGGVYKETMKLYRAGHFADAFARGMDALKNAENSGGPEHPDVATSLNTLGELCCCMEEYVKAEPFLKRALAIREKTLGPEHPDVAECLNNIAVCYKNQNLFDQAEKLFRRSLAIWEQTNHPDVALSLSNIAGLYRDQGQYTQAEPLLNRALELREKALGPDHPDLTNNVIKLANLYIIQKRYDQAEPFLKRALAIREKTLGPVHPDVALSLNSIAKCYVNQKKYVQAEPLYRRSLAIWEQTNHPYVALSLTNLAYMYQVQGQYTQAEPLLNRALELREKALGPDHPDLTNNVIKLANLYIIQKQYGQAEPLFKRALAIREKSLGPEHPDVAECLNNIAACYEKQKQYAQAEPLYKRALELQEKALGPDHPCVTKSLNRMASLYRLMRREDDAIQLEKRAAAICASKQ